MIGFALCHGWSFDAKALDALAENLSRHFPQSPVVRYDLGFTGRPFALSPDAMLRDDIRWIALGHSYGFAYLMQQGVAWQAAISVNGFTRFCRRPGKPEGTPARLLDAMIARLDSSPEATVEEFRLRCANEQDVSDQSDTPRDTTLEVPLDVALLSAHLALLRDLDLSLPACPVLSLSTHADLIVPPLLTHACFAHANCTMQEYEGSHLRLLQEPQACMTAINAFVEANRG